MADRNRGGTGSFWLGAVIGGLLGAIYALWRAPRSGEETRQALRHQLEGESVQESLAQAKAEARALNAAQRQKKAP